MFVNRVKMDELIYLTVAFEGEDLDYGYTEVYRLSMIAVMNDVMEMVHKRDKFNDEDFVLTAIIPWSKEKRKLKNDYKFLDVVNMVKAKGEKKLKIKIDKVSKTASKPTIPESLSPSLQEPIGHEIETSIQTSQVSPQLEELISQVTITNTQLLLTNTQASSGVVEWEVEDDEELYDAMNRLFAAYEDGNKQKNKNPTTSLIVIPFAVRPETIDTYEAEADDA